MIKKKIKYVDFDGVEREETFYFNLSEAELIEMEFSTTGGMMDYIERIVAEKDSMRIMKLFKEIIMLAYGEKSPDGRRFVKSTEISTAFTQTGAYSVLMLELLQDADEAGAFIEGLIPKVPNAPPSIAK